MKGLLERQVFEVLNRFTGLKKKLGRTSYILLFDSSAVAQEIAFMLDGQWDGCNGVVMFDYDEVAVNTVAKLHGASWCSRGDSAPVLIRLMADELIRRYAAGERHFINANLRCAMLAKSALSEVTLSRAKLSGANLIEANLIGADLTAADLSEANLSGVSLNKANLVRTNLTKANLGCADLRGANLSKANLSEACLCEADLRGANLSFAELRGSDLSKAQLLGANLTDAKLTLTDFERAALEDEAISNSIRQ